MVPSNSAGGILAEVSAAKQENIDTESDAQKASRCVAMDEGGLRGCRPALLSGLRTPCMPQMKPKHIIITFHDMPQQ